jgi:hypothetical protein
VLDVIEQGVESTRSFQFSSSNQFWSPQCSVFISLSVRHWFGGSQYSDHLFSPEMWSNYILASPQKSPEDSREDNVGGLTGA